MRVGEFITYKGRKTKVLDVYTDKSFGDREIYLVNVPQYEGIKSSPMTKARLIKDLQTGELRSIDRSDFIQFANGSTIEGGEYRSYVNNIYRNQSEQSAREGLMNFASEQGFEISDVENALQVYKYDTEENAWGENYYTKVAIAKMVDIISGKYSHGGGVGAYDYKTVDLRTEKGIKEAERLKEQGWKIVQMGFDTMQFERPKANSFRSVGRSIYADGGGVGEYGAYKVTFQDDTEDMLSWSEYAYANSEQQAISRSAESLNRKYPKYDFSKMKVIEVEEGDKFADGGNTSIGYSYSIGGL
jgi:hypothetical protein